MKTTKKSFFVRILSLVALLTTTSALAVDAPTPVVIWNGDFSVTEKMGTDNQSYTLSANGNTVNDDGTYITITSSRGVLIDWTTAFNAVGTVVVRYQNLPTGDLYLASFKTSDYTDMLGAGIASGSQPRVYNREYGYYSANNGLSSRPTAGSFAATYSYNTGAGVSFQNANGTWTSHNSTTAKYSAGCAFTGVTIGGTRGETSKSNTSAAEQMKITAIAIFNQCLSANDISAFKWERNWTATQPGDWSNSANWEGGIVPQNGDTVIIPVDAVVNVDDDANFAGVAIEGSGTIVYDNKLPGNEKTNYQAAAWTGTVWIKNKAVTGNDLNHIGTIGNAGSTVRFTGVSGWLNNGMLDTLPTLDLVDEDTTVALSINNGSSNTPLKFRKLTGAGTFTTSGSSSQKFYFENGEGFTGSITMQSNKGILFGATTGTVNNNQIVIAAGAMANIAAGKIWTAAGGIVVNGEVDVTVDPDHPAFASTVSGSGRVVMIGKGQNGASLRMDKAAFPGCTAAAWTGTLEIRDWLGETNANYSKFGDTHGNANSTICFNGFKGYAYASNYNAVKAYEIGENGFTISGSYSGGRFGFVGALTGSGTITLTQTGAMNANSGVNFIGDSSGFTGTFAFANATTYRVALLASANDALPSETAAKKVILGADVKTGAWTVNSDFVAMDGAIFDAAKVPTVTGALTFPATAKVELAEDVTDTEGALILTKTGLEEGTDYPTVVSATVAGEPSGFAYRFKSATDGVKVFQQSSINWVGGDGTLTDDAKWSGGTFSQDGANSVAYFPADDTATVTIPDGTTSAKSFYVKGDYTFKSEAAGQPFAVEMLAVANGAKATLDGLDVTPEQLAISEGGTLALSNGAKLNMETLELAEGMTLELSTNSTVALESVPTLNNAATIKIADAENLKPGNYLLMSWSNWPNPDLMGYGMPQLNVEGYTGAEGSIRLVPEAYKLWLQVRSAAEMARPVLTIEPIGDSITEGLNNAGGSGKNYRIPLINKLSLAGYNVKSVGYWKHNGSADNGSFDPSGTLITNPDWIYHSGKGSARAGARSSGNARVRDAWANDIDVGGAPDIVLLHIGINDMLNNTDNDTNGKQTYAYLTNIVTGVLRDRPDVKLVMSSPMCNEYGHGQQQAMFEGDSGKTDVNRTFCQPLHQMCLDFYNAVKRGELLSEIEGAAGRLFFADHYTNVMPRWYGNQPDTFLNDGSDHCHPNWLGHEKMAQGWFEQIIAAFPDPEDKAGEFHSKRTEKGTYEAKDLGATNNVPAAYMNGFKLARQFNTSFTGSEQMTPGTALTYDYTNEALPDETEIEKVGYFIEYVRQTSTTNIHRFVWVDMDAFGTVGEVGIPTMGNFQEVVNKLHVYGNHPAVFNIPENDDTVKGFVEFTPHTYDDNNIPTIAGAPAHFAPYDWHDHLSDTGAHGCMQVHRILDPADQLRPAQVVFAYNAFTANNPYTVLGIGNFSQSFQSSSTDWTNLHLTDTCNATVYSVRNIEIWVKPAVEPVAKIGEKTYETIEAALAAAQNGETVTVLQDAQLASITVPAGVTLDLNGKAVQAAAIENKGTIVIYDAATAVAFVGNDIAGTIKFGATITITCDDIGGFPPDYAKIPVYQFPQDGTLQIVPPTDMGEATLNLTLPKGGFAADMIGLEAKKVLNVTWTERDEGGNNLFALAGEICRGSRVDTVLTVSDLGKAVIQGPIIVGVDSTNPNIDYTTYSTGIATLQLLGSIRVEDPTYEKAYIKLIPGRSELITRFTVKDTGLVKTEEGAVLKESTQTIKEGVTLYYTTAEWIEPSIVPEEQGTVDITGEGEDAVAKITPAENVTKLEISAPAGFSGKYEIPVSITEITGVEINQLIIKSGDADIAPACKIENGAILLDETKSVMVDGEQIPVKPVLSDADDNVKPLAVSSESTSVGVKAIPGLTYTLVRSETIGGDTTDVDSSTATGARLSLTDNFDSAKGGKPASAFYVIQVTK